MKTAELLHDDVLPGDYTLIFSLEVDLGEGPIVQQLSTQLVVLPAATSIPEVRFLGALPRVTLARLKGMFFDTNKSFLLPASTAVFERLREIYADHDPSDLLVVGHCDTTGDASVNDPLSLERADNTAAYLRDDVDTWLAMFDDGVAKKRRWGDAEDDAMLFSMPDFETKPPDEDPLRWFQRTRGLAIDGIAGPETRRQLITEYMALDGASLTDPESKFEIEITTHGCGENFPVDDSGDEALTRRRRTMPRSAGSTRGAVFLRQGVRHRSKASRQELTKGQHRIPGMAQAGEADGRARNHHAGYHPRPSPRRRVAAAAARHVCGSCRRHDSRRENGRR